MSTGAQISATAYVLHMRPYKESSALCDLFTLEHGRLTAVAHGVRGRRGRHGGHSGSAPQTFSLLAVELVGKSELKTLRHAEAMESRWLQGTGLAVGMYLNELLVRLLPRDDPHEHLFACYGETLAAVAAASYDVPLRAFERVLLEELGYGLPLEIDHAGQPVVAEINYRLEPGTGFVADAQGGYAGAMLLAIGRGDLADLAVRRAARRLFNAMLAPHLDGRPIMSRMLLQPPRRSAQPGAGPERTET